MKTAVIHARIEPEVKSQAELVLHELGLSPTDAIRIFYRQILLNQGLPFPISIPNTLTAKTLAKSRCGKDVESFDSVNELFASWEE